MTRRDGRRKLARMGAPYKFPDPLDRSLNAPAVMCPAPRVLALYNQESGYKAQRIAKKVKEWFHARALAAGWSHVWWFPDVANGNTSGCVMAVQTMTLTITAAYKPEEGDDPLDVPVVEPPMLDE